MLNILKIYSNRYHKENVSSEVHIEVKRYKKHHIKWLLVLYDLLVYLVAAILLLVLYEGDDKLSIIGMIQQAVLSVSIIFLIRLLGNVYGQIWRYGGKLNIQVEIASITNIRAMERVFEMYHPQIVINAAAHKHVPLMEHNCIEVIENNDFMLYMCSKKPLYYLRNRSNRFATEYPYTKAKFEFYGMLSGCCFMIDSKIFKRIGYFDENVFLYF